MNILDHDLCSDETQEPNEGVHMAQPDVSERAGFGVDIVTNVEVERVLEKRVDVESNKHVIVVKL